MATKKAPKTAEQLVVEKAAKGTPKSIKDVTQMALLKTVEIGYGRFLNTDGTPIKIRRQEGYLGIKQFEALDGSDNAEAQPGTRDVTIIESEDGKYKVVFGMFIRPILHVRSLSAGGTLRNAQAPKMGSGDSDRIMAMITERLNKITSYCHQHGVIKEISRRLAQTILKGHWLARNYHNNVRVTVTADGLVADSVDVLAKGIEAAFTADTPHGKRDYVVTAEVNAMPFGEIFPSQQMTLGTPNEGAGRLYVCDSENGALLTPQKIGFEVRKYDTWTVPFIYGDDHPEAAVAIPVSAVSGQHRSLGKGVLALILGDTLAQGDKPQPNDYFAMANIIHGGLFTRQVAADAKAGGKGAGAPGEAANEPGEVAA